jgi:hypothetical protein
MTFLRVDLVASFLDVECEYLGDLLREGTNPDTDRLTATEAVREASEMLDDKPGEANDNLFTATATQPSQTCQVQLHKLLTLVPSCKKEDKSSSLIFAPHNNLSVESLSLSSPQAPPS